MFCKFYIQCSLFMRRRFKMNWLNLAYEDRARKMFWKSVWIPVLIWVYILLLLYVSLFFSIGQKDLTIFSNIISAIPYYISFKTGVITTFGMLILTLFLNVHSETKFDWSSPTEYVRGFAYQRYAYLITYFLSIVWFINFIYVLWRKYTPTDFLNSLASYKVIKLHEIDKYKFLDNYIQIDNGIPLWVFLFLSWFTISVSQYLSNANYSTHHIVMSSYKEISELSSQYIGYYFLARIIITWHKKGQLEHNCFINKFVEVIPERPNKRSPVKYIGELSPYILQGLKVIIPVHVVLIVLHIMWVIYSLKRFYGIELEINTSNVLTIIISSIICSVLFGSVSIMYWMNVIIKIEVIKRIYKKMNVFSLVYWINLLILGVFESLIFTSNLLTLLFIYINNYKGPTEVDDSIIWFSMFIPIIFSTFIIHIRYRRIAKKQLKKFEVYFNELFKKIESSYRGKYWQLFTIDAEKINVYTIARIVYLESRAKNACSEYLMFFDGNVDKLNSSLREACRVAQKDYRKFPRWTITDIMDIFS